MPFLHVYLQVSNTKESTTLNGPCLSANQSLKLLNLRLSCRFVLLGVLLLRNEGIVYNFCFLLHWKTRSTNGEHELTYNQSKIGCTYLLHKNSYPNKNVTVTKIEAENENYSYKQKSTLQQLDSNFIILFKLVPYKRSAVLDHPTLRST